MIIKKKNIYRNSFIAKAIVNRVQSTVLETTSLAILANF